MCGLWVSDTLLLPGAQKGPVMYLGPRDNCGGGAVSDLPLTLHSDPVAEVETCLSYVYASIWFMGWQSPPSVPNIHCPL